MRYEDLIAGKSDAVQTLNRALELDAETSVEPWIEYFSLTRMKELEQRGKSPSLQAKGAEWFIGGGSSENSKTVIRQAILEHRPEIARVAKEFGYEL